MPTLSYRPAALDDAELASDLMMASYPAMTHDPVMLDVADRIVELRDGELFEHAVRA